MSIPQVKRCCRCNTEKPRSDFPLSKRSTDGLFSYCRECRRAYNVARYASNPARASAQFAAWREKNVEYDRARAHAYYAANQEDRRAYRREHYANNTEAERAHSRQWRIANPEMHRAQSARYRIRYPQKYRETIFAWKKRNRDKVRVFSRSYRARKANAPGQFTEQEWRDLCALYGNVCLACGSNAPLTADHIVPLSQGGSNYIDNLQPLCGSCNSKKKARIIDYRPLS